MKEQRIHIGSESPLVLKHHINWRIQALKFLEGPSFQEELHYTSIMSVSESDARKLKALFIQMIENYNEIVARSPSEAGFCLNLDFSRLTQTA